MNKRLLCLWLPNWPIQRLRNRPGDAAPEECGPSVHPSRPIVLWRDDPRRGRLVAARCRDSAERGVRLGMSLSQADQLARAGRTESPPIEPHIETHDAPADDAALARLAVQFQQTISPLVATESLEDQPWAGQPPGRSESLLADITGIAHLFGGEPGLLDAAERLLSEQGLRGQMAIADSVGAAWALAHYAQPDRASNRPPRKPPSEKPDSLTRSTGKLEAYPTSATGKLEAYPTFRTIAPPGNSRAWVLPLPIESLRISPQTAETLHRLGIETVGELLKLPKRGLGSRFGPGLLRRIEQATAEIDEPVSAYRAPSDHQSSSELEYPTRDAEILHHRIEQLVEKIRAGLATCHRGALRLTCRLDLAIHPPLIFKIGLFAPTLDVKHLVGLIAHQIESRRLPADVIRVTVTVTLSGPLRSVQNSLFPDNPSSNHADFSGDYRTIGGSAISRLVDSLSGRLGRAAVVGVTIADDPLPEQSYRAEPLTGTPAGRTDRPAAKRHHTTHSRQPKPVSLEKKKKNPAADFGGNDRATVSGSHHPDRFASDPLPSPDDAMRRPLTLLAQPIPLVCEGPIPLTSESDHPADPRLPPERFRVEGIVHQVVRHWGPERIETGWWKGPSVGRDYYRIETDRGAWWWIFRNLDSTVRRHGQAATCRWMLHGRFD